VAEVLDAVRESGGAVVAVGEAEIVDALRDLARRGLYVEPTSATAAAGLTRLLASGAIRPDETTVLVLTGSGLKASATTGELLGLRARGE
jgi:threonine synthase